MKDTKKPVARSKTNNDNSSINPIESPAEAIDFYMPLPDDVYKKWKKQK